MEIQAVFWLLGRPVTPYALCLALAVSAGLLLFARRARADHLRPGTAGIFALLALPLGLLGARLFYCLARISFYLEIGAVHILYLWEGGFALWGAVGGGFLAGALTAKRTGQKIAPLLDALAAPAALTIALCRFAEYFSGEGIGPYVENELFCRFPFAVCNEYGEWYWSVFLLEGLAAAVIFWILAARKRRTGENTRLFLLLYSACQVLLESLRRDNFLRWLFVRVSQLTAVLVLVGLMAFGVARWLQKSREERMSAGRMALYWVGFALGVGICVALEFAIDKSASLPVWAAYCIMAPVCAGMGFCANRVALKG